MDALIMTSAIMFGSIIGAFIGVIFNIIVDKISSAKGYGDRFKLFCNLGLLVGTTMALFLYLNHHL